MLLGNGNIVSNTELRRRLYTDVKNGTLSHAYIIEGQHGSGRHTLAKNIIAALACTDGGSELPCGRCKNCRDIFEDKCPDVIRANLDEKPSLGVDAVRSIKSTLLTVPNNLEIKAYILEDADTMTAQAQNAFLLSLEEPPKNVYFFLLCENSRSLLETIRSRAATLRTEYIADTDIAEHLLSDKVAKNVSDAAKTLKRSNPEEFDTLLISANGSIGRAIELLSPKERAPIVALRNMADSFVKALLPGSGILHPLTLLPEFAAKRDGVSAQLDYIRNALRDLMLLKKSENAPLCFFTDRDVALELSDRFSERRLLAVSDQINKASDAMQRNANIHLTLIDMLSHL